VRWIIVIFEQPPNPKINGSGNDEAYQI